MIPKALESAFPDALSLVSDAAGSNTGMPGWLKFWDILPSNVDTQIDFNRWDKLYPYVLVIAEALDDYGSGLQYLEKARYILPIPPEQLNIQTPYAISVSKTLAGIVEEHNADPFKMIALSGTTGVLPLRGNRALETSNKLFGGVINSAQQTFKSASALFGGGNDSPFDDATIKGSGYGQFRLLELFLTSYVRAKKTNPNIRLLFVPFKEQKAYVVTPIMFNMRREAGRALKYRYDLQLKSWKEFPSRNLLSLSILSTQSALSFLDKALNAYKKKLSQARAVIGNARNTVRSARASFDNALDIMRETSLFLSEGMGLATSIIDLPYQLVNDSKAAFIESWDSLKTDYDALKSKYKVAIYDLNDLANGHSINRRPSVIDSYFENPNSEEASEFFKAADTSKIQYPRALQDRISAERNRVASYTAEDFARLRDTMKSNIVQITDSLGASDATYDATYRNVHAPVTRELGQADWDLLFALNDTLSVLNGLAQKGTSFPTPMEYLVGFAARSKVPFSVPTSKYAIPMPYDTSLEQLAAQHLGDADRWIEIAALNSLREPYIDEIGFSRYLLSNGRNGEIAINSNDNLVIGQAVWIQSATVKREKRHILNIRQQTPSYYVLTLDGNPDLDKYHIGDSAFIQAFLPDTVNSHQLIWLPSNDPALNLSDLSQIPGIKPDDNLLDVGGIDLLLKADNDLAITSDGDCKFAYGLQAFIQYARLALSTPRGSLIRHPTFGLPIEVGMSVADLDVNELKAAVADIFSSDPAFNGVTQVSIQQAGATCSIGLNLAVSGQNHPIPVAFQVGR